MKDNKKEKELLTWNRILLCPKTIILRLPFRNRIALFVIYLWDIGLDFGPFGPEHRSTRIGPITYSPFTSVVATPEDSPSCACLCSCCFHCPSIRWWPSSVLNNWFNSIWGSLWALWWSSIHRRVLPATASQVNPKWPAVDRHLFVRPNPTDSVASQSEWMNVHVSTEGERRKRVTNDKKIRQD